MKINPSLIKKLDAKDLMVFDLDGTIIPSKFPMDMEMSKLMAGLLQVKKVAIIGGGKYGVFKELFIHELRCKKELLRNLFLFPTTSTAFYKYNHGWKKVYSLSLSTDEINRIKRAFNDVFKKIGYRHPEKTYGTLIENRGTQVSFSVYGQDLVKVLGKKGIKMKEEWRRKNTKLKMKIARLVAKEISDLEVRAAGYTTIDVTKKGIDKAYGMRQIEKHLKIPISQMFFFGDGIFPGGNDYAIVRTGVDYKAVKDPKETKEIIRAILSFYKSKS